MTLRRVDLNAPAPADPEEPPHAVPESGHVRSLAPIVLAVIAMVLMLKYA